MNSIISDLLNNNELINRAKEDIKEVYLQDEIPWVIGYSGGKDSTTTTQIVIDTLLDMKKEGIELKKDVYVISSDTMVETPMIIETIAKTIDGINDLAKQYEIPVNARIIRPTYDRGFWANLIGRGYPCPNQTFRWCTDRMKIEPANRFINNVVSSYGEAVMILGVRNNESNSRDRVLENHTIKGKKLMRHTTMPNAYVFAPIRNFSIEDVWNYLLENPSPWGTNNKELFKLYKDSSSECPLVLDETTKKDYGSCGNSRFGCWVCTVVQKDKSLSGFIDNGVTWLIPLREYRNWLYSIRDNSSLRMKRRANGTLYFAKIKKISDTIAEITSKGNRKKLTIEFNGESWIDNENDKWVFFEGSSAENDAKNYISENNIDLSTGNDPKILIKKIDDNFYQLGPGPFTLSARKEMLRRLLTLQKNLNRDYKLIKEEELIEIKKFWLKDGDWNDSVSKIYNEIYGKELADSGEDLDLFDSDTMDLLEEICEENGMNAMIFAELIQSCRRNFGYINRQNALKEIQKILSKEFISLKNGELYED